MKRILTLLLLFITVLSYSQLNQIDVKKAYIRSWIIYQGDTLAVTSISGDTIFVTRGATLDTLYANTQWSTTGNDIQNINTGKVILPDSLYAPAMHEANKVYWFMGWNNTTGRFEKMAPTIAGDKIDSARAANPTAYTTFVRDSTYGMLSPAADADKVSEAALNDPFYHLDYWKVDFVGSYYSKTSNAKMAIMGDSYTHRYGDKLKQQVGNIYGWGGGYETFEGNTAFDIYGTNKFSTSGWTYVSITSDPYIVHSRAIRSVASGSSYYLSSKEWNKVRIHYKKRSGGGTFTVKKGSAGTAASIDTDAAAGDGWYVKDYGNVTYNQYDTLFLTSSDADSIDVYGFQFVYNVYNETLPNFESQNRRVEISLLSDGGANIKDFYTNKDTAKIHALLDTLDLSLMCFVNLDDSAGVVTELDSLISIFRTLRPEMDVAILSPHDEKNNYGNVTTPLFEKIAKQNNAAYIDVNRTVGTMEKLIASGAMTDSVHLTGAGDYFPYYAIYQRLFPPPSQQSTLTAYSLKLMGNAAIVKPNGTNFAFTSKPFTSNFTGLYNTFIGYRTGEATTTGNDNTFIGWQSGMSNTTGFSNTIIGKNAMPNLGTGYYNVSIGIASLYTSGASVRECTAVGSYALYKASTNSLTAFGYASAKFNTGAGTVSVGYNALLGVEGTSSGAYNTAVGSEVLKATTSGASNTAIGLQAMITNTTGGNNIAAGRDALRLNLSGNLNTGIGHSAGYSNSTGSGNNFIGYRAGYKETGSYKSYWAADSTSYTVGMGAGSKLLFYGDMSNADKANHTLNLYAKVGIAQSKIPTESLEVTGNALITGWISSSSHIQLSPLASPPAGATEGAIYSDTDHHLYFHNGTTWVQLDN